MCSLLYFWVIWWSRKQPTSSQTSAPSYAPIVTSNSLFPFFIHVPCLLNRRDFLEWSVILLVCVVMGVVNRELAMSIDFPNSSLEFEGYNESMYSWINLFCLLFGMFLNQSRVAFVNCYWVSSIVYLTFLFIFYKNRLFSWSSFLAGFISLQGLSFSKCALWSLSVTKAVFSEQISNLSPKFDSLAISLASLFFFFVYGGADGLAIIFSYIV